MSDLLPCPLCKSARVGENWHGQYDSQHDAVCLSCGCSAPFAAWNTRQPAPSGNGEARWVGHAKRREDMSPTGFLELFRQDDGDIVVKVWGEGFNGNSVEFCTSGGHSPKTLAALRQLMQAMAEDEPSHNLLAPLPPAPGEAAESVTACPECKPAKLWPNGDHNPPRPCKVHGKPAATDGGE